MEEELDQSAEEDEPGEGDTGDADGDDEDDGFDFRMPGRKRKQCPNVKLTMRATP